ncbi:hypothetical protein [Neptunicoccus cionae]|uniref:hypothetical protein n=1 Tax=Neptunicoccus cionae TaxID=2035344 RepID=UPI001C60B8DB|nr:hypothetical protein [Amylibacter cionae]
MKALQAQMKTEQVTFSFRGTLPAQSFLEFAQHRAKRLSLQLETQFQNNTEARMRVTGQTDLVDAFEMALSLGPPDCVVRDVQRVGTQSEKGKSQ